MTEISEKAAKQVAGEELQPSLGELADHLAADLADARLSPELTRLLIKNMISRGWRLEKIAGSDSGDSVSKFESERVSEVDSSVDAEGLLPLLRAGEKPSLNTLLSRWINRNPDCWPDDSEVYILLAERLVKMGCPLVAHDVCAEGLERCSGNVRLRQIMALALARTGATQRAKALLQELVDQGEDSEETLGLLARTDKDLWLETADPVRKASLLEQSAANYLRAYRQSGGYWTGINAATMAYLADRSDEAIKLANEVRSACLLDLEKTLAAGGDPYWALSTLGEVALILGDRAEAVARYSAAAKCGEGRFGDLASTRRNARMLLRHRNDAGADIERCFAIPPVAVFSGWIRAGQLVSPPRLSGDMENELRSRLQQRLARNGVSQAFAGAMNDAERLFLETIREMQGNTAVVFNQGKPLASDVSVDRRVGYRVESVVSQATEVLTASDYNILDETVAREFAEQFLVGVACLRARQLETDLIPIVVCDGDFERVSQDTARLWRRFEKLGLQVELLTINGAELEKARTILRSNAAEYASQNAAPCQTCQQTVSSQDKAYPTFIRALLFGDAKHFSKLQEEQIPIFHKEFLGTIGRLADSSLDAPSIKNTWGDGLYCVFDTLQKAGNFALELCDIINSIDWESRGLPPTMNIRVALHAGPVLQCVDPVTHTPTYMGTHVSRAARIEPITPVGQVYASLAFAALAAAENISSFRCEYVGQTPLAKGYGTFPTYHLRRRML